MRTGSFAHIVVLVAGMGIAYVAAVPLHGQTPSPAASRTTAGKRGMPRLPDGHPDLQGTYDVSTITPFERPQGAAETITEAEAKTREQQTVTRRARGDRPSDGQRQAPPVGGDGSSGAAGNVGGYNGFWLDQGDTWIVIDNVRRSAIVTEPDGRVPRKSVTGRGGRGGGAPAIALPTSDAGENAAPSGRGAYDNTEQRPLGERCLLGFGSTSGPPTLPNGFYNNTKQFVQTKDYVMILNEMVHDARIIRLNSSHVSPNIRKWMGDSIGWWEGDTLVVETTNFTNKTRYAGSTENLKVTERFSRLDDQTLLYKFTIDDPEAFTHPWSGEYPWRPSKGLLYEYACHEGNYALGNIMRGARLLEKEAEETAKQK
jgi:hypothetical protein